MRVSVLTFEADHANLEGAGRGYWGDAPRVLDASYIRPSRPPNAFSCA